MIIAILSVACAGLLIMLLWVIKMKEDKENNFRLLSLEKKDIAEKLAEMTARVKEVEDGVKEGFGVDIRQEITKIECVFTKLEMAIIMSGIYKLIETSGNISDKEVYIKLYRKTESNIQQMEEEKE